MGITTHKIGFLNPIYFLKPAPKNCFLNEHVTCFLTTNFGEFEEFSIEE